MQNLEADDRLTLANQIAVELNRNHVMAHVYNFGAGGFQSSLEAIKFQDLLRKAPKDRQPTAALFYDGFNEVMFGYYFGAGTMQADLSLKMKDLVEREYPRLMLYSASELLSRYSVFWRNYINHRIHNTLYGSHEYSEKADLEKTVSTYVTNVRMLEGVCTSLQIRCLFILQPLVVTKSHPTPLEKSVLDSLEPSYVEFAKQFYRQAAHALQHVDGFVDLSHVFDEGEESHFFDLGHTAPYSGIVLGKEVARAILTHKESYCRRQTHSFSSC